MASGAVPEIIAAIKVHAGVERVAEEACLALRNINSVFDPAKEACLDFGAVPVIVAVLNTHSGFATTQYALRVLENIAAIDRGKEACIDAIPAIVSTIRVYSGVSEVATRACCALINISSIGRGEDACVASGAIPAIVIALKALLSDAKFTEMACGTLCTFASNGPGENACLECGAIPVIVAAVNTHVGLAGVTHKACGMLCIISTSGPGKEACVASGAISAIVGVLRAQVGPVWHTGNVVAQACKALFNIGSDSPTHSAAIVAAGAVPLLAAACTAHSGSTRAQAHAALEKLGYTDAGVKK